jgi:hypothetical protein
MTLCRHPLHTGEALAVPLVAVLILRHNSLMAPSQAPNHLLLSACDLTAIVAWGHTQQ